MIVSEFYHAFFLCMKDKKIKQKTASFPNASESVHQFVAHPIEEEQKKKKASRRAKKDETNEGINEQLVEIYENTDGSMPDMKHFRKRQHHRLACAFTTLVGAAVLLLGAVGVGFFVIQPRTTFSEENVILSISGPEEVRVGQDVSYRIRYRNNQHIPLGKATIEVRYPAGFVFIDASREATNDRNDEWALGTLDAEGSGYIDVHGYLFGNVNEKQSFRVFLNYLPSNFNAAFQKVNTWNVAITESPLILSMDTPEKVVYGAETTMSITVAKDAEQSLTTGTLALVLEERNGFAKRESSPASDEFDPYQWTLPTFDGAYTITIKGVFAPEKGEESTMIARLVGSQEHTPNAERFVYAEKEIRVSVLKTDMNGSVVVNGSTSELTIQSGEKLNTSIYLKNNGTEPAEDVQVEMVYEMPSAENKSILLWTALDDPSDGVVAGEQMTKDIRRGSITWDATMIPAFKRLDPGDELAIDVAIPVRDSDDPILQPIQAISGQAYAVIRYRLNGAEQKFSTNPITMTLVDDLAFSVQDKKGSVDGKEMHAIAWVLEHSFHDLKDIRVEADVFGDVSWNETALLLPGGNAVFDAKKKRLVWTIPEMPTSVDVLALEFQFIINKKNPTQKNLTSKVKVQATDSITGKQIFLLGDEVLL